MTELHRLPSAVVVAWGVGSLRNSYSHICRFHLGLFDQFSFLIVCLQRVKMMIWRIMSSTLYIALVVSQLSDCPVLMQQGWSKIPDFYWLFELSKLSNCQKRDRYIPGFKTCHVQSNDRGDKMFKIQYVAARSCYHHMVITYCCNSLRTTRRIGGSI